MSDEKDESPEINLPDDEAEVIEMAGAETDEGKEPRSCTGSPHWRY